MSVNIRDVLPSIRVPTLILNRPFTRDEAVYVTGRIPGAERIEIGGPDTMFMLAEGLADEIERFVRAAWGEAEPETVLTTGALHGHRRLVRRSSVITPGGNWSVVTTR